MNVATLRIEQQQGRPVLVEFWDFCRVNSLRTLPYVRGWHERYAGDGLRVIGVHSPGFAPSADPMAARDAVARLGIEYAVALDTEHEVWRAYENAGWPARYLFDQRGLLADFHYGEGAYAETERAIQELLGVEGDVLDPVRPEDHPDALLAQQTPDQPGPWSGPYEAGGVWAVLEGRGAVVANGERTAVEHPGAYPLVLHDRHTQGVLDLALEGDAICHAVCFTPGVVSG